VLVDELQCMGDEGVFDRDDVGGAAGDDLARRDEHAAGGAAAAGDQAVEEACGFEADAGIILRDAGEGNGGEFADGEVVVDAEDGGMFGDFQAGVEAGVEDGAGDEVGGGDDADGAGEIGGPAFEEGQDAAPVDGTEVLNGDRGGRFEEGPAVAGEALAEAFAAVGAPIALGADEGEMAEAATHEVFGGAGANGVIVGGDGGEGGGDIAEHVDGGGAGGLDELEEVAVCAGEDGEDAVGALVEGSAEFAGVSAVELPGGAGFADEEGDAFHKVSPNGSIAGIYHYVACAHGGCFPGDAKMIGSLSFLDVVCRGRLGYGGCETFFGEETDHGPDAIDCLSDAGFYDEFDSRMGAGGVQPAGVAAGFV